jgi:hypothetical protein
MGPVGGKKLVLLVDDLNMPKKDTFGSQPPLELLRQWIDYGGWYDRGKQSWRFIADMQLVVAMGPPGGGRSVISERLQSRFNMINFTFPADKQVRSIFESILTPRMADFAEDVRKLVPGVVAATFGVYERVVEGFRRIYDSPDARLLSLFSAGGRTNADLPETSNYRDVTPMALTIRHRDGVSQVSPFVIEYERYNDPRYNRFFADQLAG